MVRVDWRRVGRVTLITLSFLFLAFALGRQRDQLLDYEWQVDAMRLGGSLLAYAAILVASVMIWGLTLRHFDVRPPFPVLARIWFISNLSRYIPGKIWQFVGVVELSRAAGMAPVTNVTSLIISMGFVLIGAVFVGVYMIPEALLGGLGTTIVPLRLAAPLLLIFLHPRVLNTLVQLASRLVRRPLEPWRGSPRAGLLIFALSVAQWLAMGAAFALFVSSLTPVGLEQFPILTAAFALAFVAGYVSFLPAGVGAKEGALALLLSTIMPLSVSAAIAVAARVWMTVAELIPALYYLLPSRRLGQPPLPGAAPPSRSDEDLP